MLRAMPEVRISECGMRSKLQIMKSCLKVFFINPYLPIALNSEFKTGFLFIIAATLKAQKWQARDRLCFHHSLSSLFLFEVFLGHR